jgi:hypothetical protein
MHPTDDSHPAWDAVAATIQYQTLPDFDVYDAAGWAVCDTIRRVADGEAQA